MDKKTLRLFLDWLENADLEALRARRKLLAERLKACEKSGAERFELAGVLVQLELAADEIFIRIEARELEIAQAREAAQSREPRKT